MAKSYTKLMDILYFICVFIAGGALVIMSSIIAWGVFTRYVLGTGSFWPEPISIFLAISLKMFVEMLPSWLKRWQGHLVDLLMAAICLFMVAYGASLVKTTYFQAYPEFQYIRVGVAYSAIPIGGLITLLFVIEKVFIRPSLEGAREGGG